MNLFNFIRRKEFLDKIYPEGIVNDVYLGQIMLDVQGRLSLNIHIKQKPAIDVSKWGVWGKDYDVVVIELNGSGCSNINISNWNLASYDKLNVLSKEGKRYLHQKKDSWEVSLDFDDFIFQKCSVYIDG
ncbi:hypothetical protein WKH24_23315 [Pantoea agglomerans]|uniref:hypothetical protein n=1 Tax=Enterobacter agglomerans TaxID=549 RepID=UPI001A9DCAF9|nr:hypothetical protein [Pantoea agglomerans]QTC49156.1 hypothetical protein H0Z11_12855 [Pantoea agglomerans]